MAESSKAKIGVVFLWHMHQPYYKDLVSGIYRLPWTRLHALKDYYGMVAILEEFPRIHQTFNLVPSLVMQLQEYAAGTAHEPMQEMAFKPSEALQLEERIFILQYLFQANREHLIDRYPRYRELFERMEANNFEPLRALPLLGEHDFRDLQLLSQLAWFDEIFLATDPELQALVSKGQGYSREDQELLKRKEREAIGKVLPAYRAAQERGQVELSVSPFYHPILPLLCDTDVATEAHPWVRLPHRRFQRPEDARLQLERALQLHREVFGRAPRGVWPSEGSVSAQVLELCASLGIQWIASDQQVLANSVGASFHRDQAGAMVNGDRLYASHLFSTASGQIRMLFRDHELSDLIGFVYSGMEAEAAAADFCQRIKQSAMPLYRQGKTPIVPIILDGENAWEYYPQNGRPFLKALYRRISDDPDLQCWTMSEALENQPSQPLQRVAAGSWINANFDIWIGAEEDNLAWDHLSEARDFFEERRNTAAPQKRDLALEELLIAEGSDWCWWYGPEHSTANDSDFDELYRSHLSNVYRLLDHRPPDELAHPISRGRQAALSIAPMAAISPHIDGVVTNYFEWMGAGLYSPVRQAGAMHGPAPLMRELHFGRDAENFYLRIDFYENSNDLISGLRFRIGFRGGGCQGAVVAFSPAGSDGRFEAEVRCEKQTSASSTVVGAAALRKILEVAIKLASVEANSDGQLQFQVSAWEGNFSRESLPLEGWLSVPPL